MALHVAMLLLGFPSMKGEVMRMDDLKVEKAALSESFQFTALIKKLPPRLKDFKNYLNYLKHDTKEMRRYLANSLRSYSQPWHLMIHHYFTGRSEKLGSGVAVDNYIKPFGISWLGDFVQKVAPGVFTRSQECWYKRRVQNIVAVPLPSREQCIARMQKSLHGVDGCDKLTAQGLLWHMHSLQNVDALPPSNKGLFRDVVGEVARSVVNVSVTEDVYGLPVTNNNGSGVIVNVNGTILTAFDLVANQRGWFQRQWTPKGKITVGLLDGRRVDANFVVANKDLGTAVSKIYNQCQLSAAVVGHITESNLLVNVEWLPTRKNALLAT